MIVPMEHLILVCQAKEKAQVLAELGKLGCVHVSQTIADTQAIRQATVEVQRVEQALRVLDIAEKRGIFAFKAESGSPMAALSLTALCALAKKPADQVAIKTVLEVNAVAELVTRLREEAQTLTLIAMKYAPFGTISLEKITALATAGIKVQLFKVPQKCLQTEKHNACFLLGEMNGEQYGIWLDQAPLPEGYEGVPLPQASTETMASQIALLQEGADKLVERLAQKAPQLRLMLKETHLQLLHKKTVVNVAENIQSTGELIYLQGYLPASQQAALLSLLKVQGWGCIIEPPSSTDINVPVLLEPPRLFRPITTLFKGLNILPAYSESDISVPFYAFFTLFFAMLIGDAGYGALMLIATLWAWIKFRNKQGLRSLFILLTIFASATIVWGVLSATYFGISVDKLTPMLTTLPTVAWLGEQSNMMLLCFILGSVHLSIARIWNAIQLAPDTRALAQIGWVGVIWAMFCIICGIVVTGFHQPSWTYWLLGGSALLIALFMLKPSELKTQGANLGMLPLNIVSSMGDIISYVRLFAVGLASVEVAKNFNEMAIGMEMPLWAKIPAMLFILLLGHGINLASGALSILVHAVRLNTLEFSSAKGVTWSGVEYKPFKEV